MNQLPPSPFFSLQREGEDAILTRDWPPYGLPPGCLGALYGPKSVLRLYPWLVSPVLLAGEAVLVVDGGNSFNSYDFSEIAQRAGRGPEEVLKRIHISRAFTCHQVLALVRKTGAFARRVRARVIILPGLMDTYYDEAIPAREVRRVWEATRAHLGRLARENFLLLAVCPDHLMEEKRPLRASLAQMAGRVVVYREEENGDHTLRLVKPRGEGGFFEFTVSRAFDAVWNIPGR